MTQAFDPLSGGSSLIVYVDIKSPYAFAAKDPTYALADELDIDVDWRPLTLDIPSYLGSAKLDKRGKVEQSNRTPEQWGGVRYAYMDARRYASAWGYGLRGTEKIWDTRLIHLGLTWVKRSDPAGRHEVRSFLNSVYPRFWLRDLDVEDMDVVVSQIEAAGVPAAGFSDWVSGAGGLEHDAEQAAIFAAGIYGVPGYIHDKQYYFGREHLPPLRRMLMGEQTGGIDVGFPLPAHETLAALGEGKHSAFLDMSRAAVAGTLKITAAINPDCLQTHLALRTIEELRKAYPDRLSITYGEAQSSQTAPTAKDHDKTDPNLSRGDAHRAFRSRYRSTDAQRYANWRSVLGDDAVRRCKELSFNSDASDLLSASGVTESFGFVYVDAAGVSHPFNGRAHLATLRWALDSTDLGQ